MKIIEKDIFPGKSQLKLTCINCSKTIEVQGAYSLGDPIICVCGAIYEINDFNQIRLEFIGFKKEAYFMCRGID